MNILSKLRALFCKVFNCHSVAAQPPTPSKPVDLHQLIVLLSPAMNRVMPRSLVVLRNFGPESVHTPHRLYHGNVVMLEGPTDDMQTWVRMFDGVWTSNNPVFGSWTFMAASRSGVDTHLIDGYKGDTQ